VSGRTAAVSPEQQVQEDLARLDAYRAQLNNLVQQHQYLAASRGDHVRAKETLEGLDRVDASAEFLIPIGGEAFLRGAPSAGAPVLVGVGSGIIAELDRPKVIELIAARLTKIDEAARELEGQIRTLDERVQLLGQRLEAMSQGAPPSGAGEPGPDDVGGD
jgi:prefoldin alpha subunit